jgi:hemoglobin
MSIYDTIGGEEALVSVVDDFYVRVLADPDLASYFAGANMNKLKGRQVAFFAEALGGPALYDGASMREAHLGRGISHDAFNKVATHLAESLSAAGVPADLVATIIGTIAPLADEIVAAGI